MVKSLHRLAGLFTMLVLPLSPLGCGDDDGGGGSSTFNCTLSPGIWRATYTLRAGSDRDCEQIPERTLQIGGLSGSAGSESSCPEGCTCSSRSNDTTCSSSFDQSCDLGDLNCEFRFESSIFGRGVCDVSTDIDCTFDITVAWETP